MPLVLQDPDEALTYTEDWSDWLAAVSPADSIVTSTWSATPSTGVTVTSRGISGDFTSVRISGLTRTTLYTLTNQITSADGDTGERSILIWCEKR